MASRAAASPAWLGLFAAASFGGLVLAAFASGYHLVGRAAPRGTAVPPSGAVLQRSGASERSPTPDPSRVESAPASPTPAPPAPTPAVAGAASDGAKPAGTAEAPASEKAPVARKARAGTAGQTATVRQHLPAARAVLRSKPDGHDRVAVLIGKQQVTILARQGHWYRIEYRRFGKTITGWTDEANLALP